MKIDIWFKILLKYYQLDIYHDFDYCFHYTTELMWELIKIIALLRVELYARRQYIILSISTLLVGRGKEKLPVKLFSVEHYGTLERMLGYKWGSEVLISVLSVIFRIKLSKSVHLSELVSLLVKWLWYYLPLFLLAFYCFITNYHKFSGFKQHPFIIAHVL